MPICTKSIDALILVCTAEIHCELHQIYLQISSEEIHRLADNLLCQNSLEWPVVLFDLQKGRSLSRLLDHLNLQVKEHGFSSEECLTFKGPFPTLSLRSLQVIVDEYRSTIRTARCIEFLGNKAWNYSFKSLTNNRLPFHVNIASLALENLGFSTKQQMKIVLLDLSERIKGCILNFLYDWENLLTQQTREQLLSFKQDIYPSITEEAV